MRSARAVFARFWVPSPQHCRGLVSSLDEPGPLPGGPAGTLRLLRHCWCALYPQPHRAPSPPPEGLGQDTPAAFITNRSGAGELGQWCHACLANTGPELEKKSLSSSTFCRLRCPGVLVDMCEAPGHGTGSAVRTDTSMVPEPHCGLLCVH